MTPRPFNAVDAGDWLQHYNMSHFQGPRLFHTARRRASRFETRRISSLNTRGDLLTTRLS